MTYITTTIINLEKEPDAYHTKEDEFEYYSVHISYEINPTNGCDEILIKEQYFDWLKELSNLKFYVFNADGDSKKYKQSGENVEVIYPPENDTICDNNQIKKWIDNNISNIVSSRDTVKYELEISDNDKPIFTIADLLKSSAQWPAPLPHKACLKKIVKIPSTIAKNSILVAFSKQITSLPILKPDSNGNGMNETTYCFYVENNSNERFYTEIIPKVKSAAKESYPNTLSDIGFFQLNEEAHRDYLVLKLINERSPHALNTLEALLDIKESDLKPDPNEEDQTKEKKAKTIKAYAQACAISLFDPIAIALLMPGLSGLNGTLLSSFKNILLKQGNNAGWIQENFITPFIAKYKETSEIYLSDYLGLKEDSLIKFCVDDEVLKIADKIKNGELTFSKIREEFIKLNADLHDESVFESCICKVFEAVIANIENNKEILVKGLSEFKSLLNGQYNAVDAVRFDLAKVFAKALTARKPKDERSIQALLEENLKKSNYFYLRYFDGSTKQISDDEPFNDVISVLIKNSFIKDNIIDDKKEVLKKSLNSRLELFFELVKSQLDKKGKFIPDATPIPLPIRVAMDPYDKAMSNFQERWAGIGIMINRANAGWKHACVGNLKIDSSEVQNSLVPISLAQQDGAYELYLEFHGFPLINTNPSSDSTLIPFYTETESSSSKVPKLVYGMDYQIAAFAVTMGGVLPKQVRENGKLCLPNLQNLEIPKEYTYSTPYLRTTAIGKVDIAHFPNSNESERRINKSYPDVDPLNLDEPRLSICATNNFCQHLDVYRNIDGSGIIDIEKSSVITISQLKVHGAENAMLCLEIGSGNALLNDLKAQIKIQSEKESLKIGFNNDKGVDVYFEGLKPREKYWVQLSINSQQESNVAISFAKPDYLANIDNLTKDKPANLLLIAKENEDQWRAPFNKSFFGQITLSRVSFLDFEHWFPLDGGVNTNLLNALNYGMELRKIGAKLANSKVLDNLPDPAVTGFLLTLSPINSIIENQVATTQYLYIPNNLEELLKKNPPSEETDSNSLNSYLGKLNRYFTLTLNVECKDGNDLKILLTEDLVNIYVPEGLIAKLTIQPVVTVETMKQKFAERMKELKIGEGDFDSKPCWIMPGESLTIEAMHFDYKEEIEENLNKEINITTPKKHTRKYQLTLENINKFRRFKSVEIESQRWRHSGIAQYQWLKPTKQDSDVFTESEIKDFEDELFVERENDYDGYKTKLGITNSLLQEFQWEQPSATWFRHRVKFYSRYQGALAKEGKAFTFFEFEIENSKNKKVAWTHRAGLLANPTHKQLPIPQPRALIPLPLPPDEKGVSSPPILCINEEPPCPFGLADRFVALIENGLSYVYEDTQKPGKVIPIDFRKEIGPDPRQSYIPFVNDSEAVLDVEGPFGLHFEKLETAGANWVNSQFFIHPRMLDGIPIKSETFIGIRLLRILDPDWVVSKNISEILNESKFSIAQTVWIEGINKSLKVCVNSKNIFRIKNNKFVVCNSFIDSASASANGTLDLISLEKINLSSIKVLHQPTNQNAGRFIIFESIETCAEIGVSNNLRPITYFEWKMPESIANALKIEVSGCERIREAFASDLSPMQWTRTSPNKNIVWGIEAINTTNDIQYKIYDVSQLETSVKDKKLKVNYEDRPIWLYPSIQQPNTPQKVHSRYFAVFTGHTKEKGTPLETYKAITLLAGKDISIENIDDAKEVKNIRFGLMQSPCKNLVSGNSNCDEIHKNIYFDLIAHKKNNDVCNLHFHFTFRHSQTFDDKNVLKVKINDYEIVSLNPKDVFAIDIWLDKNMTYCTYITTNGVVKLHERTYSLSSIGDLDGLKLSMDYSSELWANVSMLVGSKKINPDNLYDFDFDWIFSNNKNTELTTIPTSKDSLKNMLEPTAQIVSISAPIIVLNNGN